MPKKMKVLESTFMPNNIPETGEQQKVLLLHLNNLFI